MGEHLVGRDEEIGRIREALVEIAAPVLVHGESGVGKTVVLRAALSGRPHREGGALATVSWMAYLPLRRAFGELPEDTWTGDPEHVAAAVESSLDGDALFLDDLQWADPGSRSVVGLLAGRVRLVASVRRGDPAAPEVVDLLDGLGALRMDLEPLATDDALTLVRRLRPRLPDVTAGSVVTRSGGNPLLIEELVDADADVASLRLALLARCRALPEGQLHGLAMLAVAGHPLASHVVPGQSGLLASGLVHEKGGELTIRHALVGEVIGDLISEDRRVRCHLALADVLTHPGDVARHLLAAGDHDRAHELALRAVEEAATPGERWRHLVTAAESAPPGRGNRLRIEGAEAANRAADPAEAMRLLDQVVDEPESRARAELARAVACYQSGDQDGYRARVESAEQAALPGTPEWLAVLLKRCSIALLLDNDVDAAAGLAREALRFAEEQGLPTGDPAKALGTVLSTRDEPGWEEMFTHAIAAAREDGDVYLEATSAFNMVIGLEVAGDLDRAQKLAEDMVARFGELRLSNWTWSFEATLMVLAAMRGDHDRALALGERLLALPLRGSDRLDVIAHVGAVRAELGEVVAALAAADELAEHTRFEATAHELRLLTYFLAGRPADVLAAHERLLATPGVDDFQVLDAAPLAAWAAWEVGRPLPEPPPDLPTRGLFAGVAPELEGIRALIEDRPVEAAQHFRDAARGHHPVCRPELHCGWAIGEALRLADDPGAEQALLAAEAAARAAEQVGTVNRCERSLRLLGVRRSAAVVRRDGSPLTEREHEVVALAAAGFTDHEIAARLGLAHRTVQSHVASARRKLGADNRRHLVALVAGART